jgi:hypothetical protein
MFYFHPHQSNKHTRPKSNFNHFSHERSAHKRHVVITFGTVLQIVCTQQSLTIYSVFCWRQVSGFVTPSSGHRHLFAQHCAPWRVSHWWITACDVYFKISFLISILHVFQFIRPKVGYYPNRPFFVTSTFLTVPLHINSITASSTSAYVTCDVTIVKLQTGHILVSCYNQSCFYFDKNFRF